MSSLPATAPLAETVERWHDRPVLVIGDVLLDEWRFTEPQRLCREAPAPVVRLQRRRDSPGGAANTAVNLAALGARPRLVGPVGADDAGRRVRVRLAAAGVGDATVTVPGRRTPVKRRLVAGDQILLCEEEGPPPGPLPAGTPRQLIGALEEALAGGCGPAPVLLVCDYDAGGLDDEIRRWLVAHRAAFPLLGVDAHDLGRWAALRPTLVTPSYAEAVRLLGTAAEPDRVAAVLERREDLVRRTRAEVTAVTLDEAGAVVLPVGDDPYRTRTRPARPCHTVGAGDAYLAAMALALATGSGPAVAAEVAQLAAAATVGATGTCVCSRAELLAAVTAAPAAAGSDGVGAAELAELVRRHRERGARVVFTNGCFDVLHRGHVRYLTQARSLGDVLVVAVNGDDSVRRLKGAGRPVNPAEDRVAVLAALACVDHVVVFEEDSPARLLEAVRPHVYVKGGDYRPELVPEAPLARRLGCEVHTLDYVPDRSTSAIIDRIRRHGQPGAPVPDAQGL